ncbi:MAG: MBL fold metallo-hydrolase, partial [Desulfurococcales archaeon]|nr:MBL fold metallo-hydrolase [Desulfurococcales archaeon]
MEKAAIEVKVLGGGGEVGRAAFFVIDKKCEKGILLDYGVNFDEEGRPRFPEHIRPIDIAGIVISHSHLDHIGAAPQLFISATPPIIMTRPTLEVGEFLLKDFMKLSAYYIDYEEGEIKVMKENSVLIDYAEEIEVNGYNIMLTDAGHIIGSGIIYLTTPSGHRILYTGDVNTIQTWTLKKAELWPIKIDTIIIESTYGNVRHPPRYMTEKLLVESIEEVIDNGGTVLIPAFSVGRSQEVISLLAAELPHVTVFLDGMSREVTDIYLRNKKFLRDPELFRKAVENTRFIRDWYDRRRAWKIPSIIVSSAGMLKGGPALYYLKKIADNPRNAVFLVSYQSPDSPGHEILEKGKIEKLGLAIKARLQWFDLSSHAGKDGLLEIVYHYRNTVKNIVIVHGDDQSRTVLAEMIREKLGNDINIVLPENNHIIELY